MPQYYDYILGLIPATFITTTAGLTLTGISTQLGVGIAGAISMLLVGHALFINSPTHPPREPDQPTPAETETAPQPEPRLTTSD